MSDKQALEQLTPFLGTIPSSSIIPPNVPIATAHQEAHELLEFLDSAVVQERIARNPRATALLGELRAALPASRAAQAQWAVARERGKSETQKQREQEGFAQRRKTLTACDFFLEEIEEALEPLSLIREGEGVDDLIGDLDTIAQLIESHSAAFDDEQFNPAQVAAQLRAQATLIREGKANTAHSLEYGEIRELRDRAMSHMVRLVQGLRRFGRFAFYGQKGVVERFSSAYARRRGQRYRARKIAAASNMPSVEV